MSKKPLTISLVIPVYNEESHVAACLRSALTQAVPFTEIIVIDNNSSDDTAAIAAGFPGVKLERETRQGVVYARNRGFNTARGDIIARIDADTLLPADWTTRLLDAFLSQDVAAVSGAIHYHDVAANRIIDALDIRIRNWLARKMAARTFLLGANMAIRRRSWQAVRRDVCAHSGMHEDMDLALHLAEREQRVVFEPSLLAGVSGRRVDTNVADFVQYLRSLPASYTSHGARESRYMYPVIAFVLLNYLPLLILYRGYDVQSQKFSLGKLLGTGPTLAARVNPATYID